MTAPFDEKVMELQDAIAYRRVTTVEDWETVHGMRHEAYLRARYHSGGQEYVPEEEWDAGYDGDPNCFNFLVEEREGGRALGCFRVHVASKRHPRLPNEKMIPELARKWIDEGKVLVDCTRFAHVEGMSGRLRLLPYVTLRLSVMATVHFDADYGIQVVLRKHAPFYEKTIWSELIDTRQVTLGSGAPVEAGILRSDARKGRKLIYREQAHFLSTPAERAALFAPASDGRAVLPTARAVIYGGAPSGY